MSNGYEYGFLLAGYGRARWRRATLSDLLRMRKARRRRGNDWRLLV